MDYYKFFTEDNRTGQKSREKYLKKNYSNLYNIIMEYSMNNSLNIPFKEKIYHFLNKTKSIPKCLECGKNNNYYNINLGYSKFCSNKCAKTSPIPVERQKECWKQKTDKEINDFIFKRNKTYEYKYGENWLKTIQNNRLNNVFEKYGVENVFELSSIKIKRKKTLKEKYGDENFNNKEKTKSTRIKNGTQINDSNIKGWLQYKKVVTNKSITNYRNNESVINPDGLIRGMKKYHIDHCFSVKQGYLNNIPIEIISHPCNLQLLYYKHNLEKQDSCSITIEELYEKIRKYS